MLRELLNSSTLAAVDTPPTLKPPPGVGGGDILGMGVSMFIVIAVIVVLGWLYSRSRFNGGGSSDVINVVATRALGPKERLLVVEVADQQLLVGMTASGVQTLHVFEKPVCIATKAAQPAGFANRLRSAFEEIGK
ncbi:MAG: flagellar biosynthetic protein FliO [Gammaproteobacteria bacterium]|nr:flagellar biosynthetic protein FliO [Gammaproteobacteria bacterium]